MLNETLAALAASAGTGVVTAMVTDGWQQARARVARLLGQGDPQEEERQGARLDRDRRELVRVSGDGADEARRRQSERWRVRFEDLLEDVPQAESELREVIAFLAEQGASASASVVQVNSQAHGHAQQAVQGQGVQNNTFTTPPVSP